MIDTMKRQAVITGLLVVGLLAVFLATNPQKLSAVILFAVLVLIYIVCAQLLVLAMMLGKLLLGSGWKTSIIRRVAYSVALLPASLLFLQSIGQLTVRDVLLVVAFVVVAFLYVGRMTRSASE